MNTKQGELLNTQGNAENNPNSNSTLIEREPIKGTPFTLIKLENKYFLVMGDYKITEETNTKEEAIQWIEDNKWLVIFNICAIAIDKMSIENDNYKKWKQNNLNEEKNTYETTSL